MANHPNPQAGDIRKAIIGPKTKTLHKISGHSITAVLRLVNNLAIRRPNFRSEEESSSARSRQRSREITSDEVIDILSSVRA